MESNIGRDEAATYLDIVDSASQKATPRSTALTRWGLPVLFGVYLGAVSYGSDTGLLIGGIFAIVLVATIVLSMRTKGKRKNPRQDPFKEDKGRPDWYIPLFAILIVNSLQFIIPSLPLSAAVIVGIIGFIGMAMVTHHFTPEVSS